MPHAFQPTFGRPDVCAATDCHHARIHASHAANAEREPEPDPMVRNPAALTFAAAHEWLVLGGTLIAPAQDELPEQRFELGVDGICLIDGVEADADAFAYELALECKDDE